MNTTQMQKRMGQRLSLSIVMVFVLCSASVAKSYDVMVQGAVDGELQPLLSALEGKRLVQK